MSSKPSSPDRIATAVGYATDRAGENIDEAADRDIAAAALDAAARELRTIARDHTANGRGHMTWAECTTKLTRWAAELRGDTPDNPVEDPK